MQTLWALVLAITAQEPTLESGVSRLVDELVAPEVRRVHGALERLIALGEKAIGEIEKHSKTAGPRIRSYLELAVDDIRATRDLPPLDRLPPRVTVKSDHKTAPELFAQVQLETGFPILLEAPDKDAVPPNLKVELEGVTPLEAFQEIARRGGYYTGFEEGRLHLRASGGSPFHEGSYFGHFLIHLEYYSHIRRFDFEKPAEDYFQLQMEFNHDPRIKTFVVLPSETILEARDDKGKDLVLPPEQSRHAHRKKEEILRHWITPNNLTFLPRLRPPSPGGQKIVVLRGIFKIAQPATRTAVVFGDLKKGGTRVADDVEVVLEPMTAKEQAVVEVSSKTLPPEELKKIPVTADALRSDGSRTQGKVSPQTTQGKTVLRFDFVDAFAVRGALAGFNLAKERAPIERIEVSILKGAIVRKIPFEFRDLELK